MKEKETDIRGMDTHRSATQIEANAREKKPSSRANRQQHQQHLEDAVSWVRVINEAEEMDSDDDLRECIDMDLLQNEALLTLDHMVKQMAKGFKALDSKFRTLRDNSESQFEETFRQQAKALSRADEAEARAAVAEAAVALLTEEQLESKRVITHLSDELNSLKSRLQQQTDDNARQNRENKETESRQLYRIAAFQKQFDTLEWRLDVIEQNHAAAQQRLRSDLAGITAAAQHASHQVGQLEHELQCKFSAAQAAPTKHIVSLERKLELEASERKRRDAQVDDELTRFCDALKYSATRGAIR